MAQDKLDELKSILLGDEIKRFDTRFMEFGDKLQRLSEAAKSGGDVDAIKRSVEEQVAALDEKLAKIKDQVKGGFEKIIETVNSHVKRLEGDMARNEKEVELMKKKFEAFKTLFADK